MYSYINKFNHVAENIYLKIDINSIKKSIYRFRKLSNSLQKLQLTNVSKNGWQQKNFVFKSAYLNLENILVWEISKDKNALRNQREIRNRLL